MSATKVAVHLDVCVELIGIALNVNLAFGPFSSREQAEQWATNVEEIHKELEAHLVSETIFDDAGYPTRPYHDVHVSIRMIQEDSLVHELADTLISPGRMEVTAVMLAEYAVRAAHEAVTHSIMLFDGK